MRETFYKQDLGKNIDVSYKNKRAKFYDTLPSKVKQEFFSDKQMPNLMRDYDVIGFDVSHTFVKYNIDFFVRHIVEGFLKDLHENFGYPEDILDFNYSQNLGTCLNCAVWDIDNGTILKLGEG